MDLSDRETDPDDRIIIADTGKRNVALFADKVNDILKIDDSQFIDAQNTMPYADYIKGIAKIDNEIILIYDLEQFLSLNEDKELEEAMKSQIK